MAKAKPEQIAPFVAKAKKEKHQGNIEAGLRFTGFLVLCWLLDGDVSEWATQMHVGVEENLRKWDEESKQRLLMQEKAITTLCWLLDGDPTTWATACAELKRQFDEEMREYDEEDRK